MNNDVTRQDKVAVLSPRGKLMGGAQSEDLHERIHSLIAKGVERVIIDLLEVEWINSSGLGVLIAGLTSLRNASGDLRLSNASPRIEDLLSRTKLLSVFHIYESTDSAVNSFE
jgi:anti-sigma B factor antagonist